MISARPWQVIGRNFDKCEKGHGIFQLSREGKHGQCLAQYTLPAD